MTGVQTCALPILFVLIALVISYFVWNYEPKYAENEITEDLCIEIVRREMEEDMPIQIAGIQKVDDSIIVGYAVGEEYSMKLFGYLQFVLDETQDTYKLYCNQTNMLDIFYSDVNACSFTTKNNRQELLQSYYIILGCRDDVKKLEVWTKVIDIYKLQQQFNIVDDVFMCIWKKPPVGKYVLVGSSGEELVCRYFNSEHKNITNKNSDTLLLQFDIDYSDLFYGHRANMNCLVTLVNTTNPQDYYVAGLKLRQTSRPCTAWNYTKVNSYLKKTYIEYAYCMDDLLDTIDIPEEYDNVNTTIYGQNYIQSNIKYARSFQVEPNKKFILKQPGQFINIISKYSDYFNKPDEENELLKENILQIEWLIDIRDNSENETKTYTVRQNVPIIIK